MNRACRQSVLAGRRLAAALDAAALPGLRDEPVARPPDLREGLARIESNLGGGTYLITELWWDAQAEEWTAASAPLGYYHAEALDYVNNIHGAAGQIVRFWEHRGLKGEVRPFIDVSGGWDGLQKFSAFTVHYSGSNTTEAFHTVPCCKNAFVEVGIDVRRCTAHVPPADHPGYTDMQLTGGYLEFGWCNSLATWSGGSWVNLQYTARLATGELEGDGPDAISDFHVQCRVTAGGDLDFRIENLTGGVVSAVIMAAIRVTLCPPLDAAVEIGNCCCHDDNWGT